MKELFLVSAESTKDSLVLRTEDDEQYFLVVTDDLRTALVGDSLTPAADIADADQETADTASPSTLRPQPARTRRRTQRTTPMIPRLPLTLMQRNPQLLRRLSPRFIPPV